MKWPSGGVVAAAIAGLVVVAAGVWGQVASIGSEQSEESGIFVAWVDFFGATSPTQLRVQNAANHTPTVLVDGQSRIPSAPAWSPDGKWLAWYEIRCLGCEAPTVFVVLWDRQRNVRRAFEADSQGLSSLVWSADSELLASAGAPLNVWDRRGKLLATGPLADPQVRTIAGPADIWSTDGQRLAYGFGDRIIYFARDARRVESWQAADVGLPNTPAGYLLLGWSSSSTLIAVARADTRVWEVNVLSRTATEKTAADAPGLESELPAVVAAAQLRVPGATPTYGRTVDGHGTFAVAASPADMVQGKAIVFVELLGALTELEIETTDPTFRNISVVLVGAWPEP